MSLIVGVALSVVVERENYFRCTKDFTHGAPTEELADCRRQMKTRPTPYRLALCMSTINFLHFCSGILVRW